MYLLILVSFFLLLYIIAKLALENIKQKLN